MFKKYPKTNKFDDSPSLDPRSSATGKSGLLVLPQNIKYIITLDADTILPLNSGLELIGAMTHILNKPELSKNGEVVEKGHAIIGPRMSVDILSSRKSLFAKIFAGSSGIGAYEQAISEIYQDNFNEGIFTGKGIYDLKVFHKIFKNKIPENIVLSHDLLEGSFLRCGLATDIVLIEGFPYKYNAHMRKNSQMDKRRLANSKMAE